jgi:hypothetical protein
MKLLDQNGNLRGWVGVAIGALGAIVLAAPLYFELHIYFVLAGFVAGSLLMGISGLAGRSAVLDLRAFTNDPLGWRKAKESYKDDGSRPAKKPGLLARLFGQK